MKQPNSTVKTLIGPIESIQGIPEYKTGLGYSPASGPAVGRPIIGPGNYFQYNVEKLSPKSPNYLNYNKNRYFKFGAIERNPNSIPIAGPRLTDLPKPGNFITL